MSVRTRITVAFVAVFLGCLAVAYAVEHFTVLQEFEALEAEAAERNSIRWQHAVERELTHLTALAADWTVGGEALSVLRAGDPAAIEANLYPVDWLEEVELPVLRFHSPDGTMLWSWQTNPATGDPIEIPELDRAVVEGGVLATDAERPEASGLIATSRGVLLVASRAILAPDKATPAAGFAVIARFANPDLLETFVRQAVSNGDLCTLAELRARGPGGVDLAARLAGGAPAHIRGEGTVSTYVALRDVVGRPSIVVRSETPMSISEQGRVAMWLSVFSLGGAGFAALAVQLLLVNRIVLIPLNRLVEHARTVKSTGDLTARFGSSSADEIGQLASEFDEMVRRLSESHAELVARSRVVGKAEIASNVAHNVGNVLNSAAVSADALAQIASRIRTDGCAKAAELLEGHPGGVEAFLKNDPRGAQLPRYLRSLSESIARDRERLQAEITRVQEQLGHMSDILDTHRDVARQVGYHEPCDPGAAIDRAVALLAPSFERHGIAVERQIAPAPQLQTDPVQLLQILVNLLTNAKEAVASGPEGAERRIRIALAARADQVHITVTDTGRGIAPENLDAVFRAGFSTKAPSGGIGLHFCSIAASRLGGTLTAASPGEGRGATFTLELPTRQREGRAAA